MTSPASSFWAWLLILCLSVTDRNWKEQNTSGGSYQQAGGASRRAGKEIPPALCVEKIPCCIAGFCSCQLWDFSFTSELLQHGFYTCDSWRVQVKIAAVRLRHILRKVNYRIEYLKASLVSSANVNCQSLFFMSQLSWEYLLTREYFRFKQNA